MARLIFVGGSKGVGKSTLARAIAEDKGFEYVNTGERFRKYRPNYDRLFCGELISTDKDTIIDTHYAASFSKTPYDFEMGMDEKYQLHLRFNSSHNGKVILVEASPEIVLSRREMDGDSRRCLDIEQIIKENNFNSAYARIYASSLDFPFQEFRNEGLSLNEAIRKMGEIIE